MKKYVVGLVGVIVLFCGSVIYKQQNTMFYQHFPVPGDLEKKASDAAPFYLFLFFTKKDCISCLGRNIVGILNDLPSPFCAVGVAPGEELKDETGLRRLVGVSFPIYKYQEFKRYLPWHIPTLFGVSPSGKIIFVLPGIPGQQSNLKNILLSTYGKLYPSFEREFALMAGGSKKSGGKRP
jgi:hypothetical protein